MSSSIVDVEKATLRALPQPLTAICALAAAGGAAAFVYGVMTEPTIAWLSFSRTSCSTPRWHRRA